MKTEFNLEKALSGEHKVFTLRGEEVTQLTKFEGVDKEYHSLYGVLSGTVESWSDTGQYLYRSTKSNLDLKSVPK